LTRNKIIIGYVFESSPKLGGNFQTEISTALRLKNLKSDRIEIKFFSINKNNLEILEKYNLQIKYFNKKFTNLNIIKIYDYLTGKLIKKLFNFIFNLNKFESFLLSNSVDLVYFNSMSSTALFLKKIDYIVSFWDMAHLDYPLFPECKENYHSISAREYIYKTLADQSLYIITDSKEGMRKFLKRYNVEEKKLKIIYSEPSSQILKRKKVDDNFSTEVLKKFELLNKKFIFYPAQYWAHKNHIYIIEAISLIEKKKDKELIAVFCGTDKNNLDYLKSFTKKLKIEKSIKFLDFLSEDELNELYKNSFAIVVPTYFGPTNHLPIEGFYFEKPVFYSNIWSDIEQVKDAVISIDLNNPNDLANKLLKFLSNKDLEEEFKQKSRDKYNQLKYKFDGNKKIFDEIFESYRTLRGTYK
tara:strand:- start:4109 stop:5347 length:1239 start_codon:yes stop_codon:yes gene_type:complete